MLNLVASASLILLLLFPAAAAYAASADAPGAQELELSLVRRRDTFDWNIGSYNSNEMKFINVRSELEWDDLEILQLHVGAWTPVTGKFYIKGRFGYGWIYDGESRDSDYDGDDRTSEAERTTAASDDGDVWDASAGVGYTFLDAGVELSSLIGYSYHMQNLRMTDGVKAIPATGPFDGLQNSYDALWFGPWVGLDLRYGGPWRKFRFSGSLEYHFVEFKARGNWSNRMDLQHPVSFEHTADGKGVVVSAGADYLYSDSVAFNMTLLTQVWKADDGVDMTFQSDGTTGSAQLNEVNWVSRSVAFGIKYLY